MFPKFDSEPQWRQVIVANGIANGLFMVVPNRNTGVTARLRFYGSSFISDPYGRVLVRAPRREGPLLIADLDLDQCRDWLEALSLISMGRPDNYGAIAETA